MDDGGHAYHYADEAEWDRAGTALEGWVEPSHLSHPTFISPRLMKLYFMPGACSLAPHIELKEAGISFDLDRVGRDKRTEAGENYLSINRKGSVPALKLDDGEVRTEAAIIQQYIGDNAPAKKATSGPRHT